MKSIRVRLDEKFRDSFRKLFQIDASNQKFFVRRRLAAQQFDLVFLNSKRICQDINDRRSRFSFFRRLADGHFQRAVVHSRHTVPSGTRLRFDGQYKTVRSLFQGDQRDSSLTTNEDRRIDLVQADRLSLVFVV